MNTGKIIGGAALLAVAIWVCTIMPAYARSYSQVSWWGNFRHSGIGTVNRRI
jgi:hypothetical protein